MTTHLDEPYFSDTPSPALPIKPMTTKHHSHNLNSTPRYNVTHIESKLKFHNPNINTKYIALTYEKRPLLTPQISKLTLPKKKFATQQL